MPSCWQISPVGGRIQIVRGRKRLARRCTLAALSIHSFRKGPPKPLASPRFNLPSFPREQYMTSDGIFALQMSLHSPVSDLITIVFFRIVTIMPI
jgi:hypothetical protein